MQTLTFVGLGNPGSAYQHTRHNLGIAVLQQWAAQTQVTLGSSLVWQQRGSVDRLVLDLPNEQVRVHCIFPLTFMNKSGEAVAAYLRNEQLPVTSLVIAHDEIELPAGETRLQRGGSAKGHKGVRSVFASLSTQDIARLRLGIGRPTDLSVDEYVLGTFTDGEKAIVEEVTGKAITTLDRVVREGIDGTEDSIK